MSIEGQIEREEARARAQVSAAVRRASRRPPMHVEIPEKPGGETRILPVSTEQKVEVEKWKREQLGKIAEWGRVTKKEVAVAEAARQPTGVTYEGLTAEEERIIRDYGPEEVMRRRQIAAEQEWHEEIQAVKAELAPYESDGGYDIGGMLDAGYTESRLVELGFAEDSIRETKEFRTSNIEVSPDVWVDKKEWNKLTPSQQQEVINTGQYTVTTPVGVEEGAPSPGVSQAYYQIQTPTALVQIPAEEWEKLSDVKKLETFLGRPPTSEEYRAYALEQELGIHSLAPSALQDLPDNLITRVAKGAAELLWRGPGSLITGPIAMAQMHIPGMQTIERYHLAEAAALERWHKEYPKMAYASFLSSPLEVAGFPAIKAVYPQITVKDITKQEWAATGINIAMLTLPAWLPKAVKGVKWAGTKIGGVAQKFTARFGTWPFSETPGLKRAPISTKAPTPKILKELPYSRQQYEAVGEALRKLRQGKGLGQASKVLKTDVFEKVKWPRRGPAPGLPQRTYPSKVGKTPYVSAAEWEKMWKPSKVTPTKVSLPQAPVGGVTEWLKPRIQAVWVKTPLGRYMPAGATPILIPDIPLLVPIRALGFPTYGVTPTPISKLIPTQVSILTPTFAPVRLGQLAPTLVKQLTPLQIKQLTPLQVQQLDIAALTATQIRALTATQIKNLTSTQVKTLTTTQLEHLTAAQVKNLTSTQVQALTSTQIKALAATQVKSMTATQVKALTSTQIKNLTTTQVKNLTSTQLRNMTSTQLKNLTSIQLKTMTTTQLKIIDKVLKRVPKKVTKKKFKLPPLPRAKEEKRKERDLPPGTDIWQQGFIKKVVPPPYSGIKPYSEYNPVPKGEGSPYDTFRIVGGRQMISGEVDLGITDIKFDKGIEFTGHGGRTNVGERDPSPYRGMTIRRKKQPVSLRM